MLSYIRRHIIRNMNYFMQKNNSRLDTEIAEYKLLRSCNLVALELVDNKIWILGRD